MENKKYKVEFYKDNTYEVLERLVLNEYVSWEKVYQGSLADCEAYIRLHEGGYM